MCRLQNELFFNIQINNELNGSALDQSRTYLAASYRFFKKMHIEAGYLIKLYTEERVMRLIMWFN